MRTRAVFVSALTVTAAPAQTTAPAVEARVAAFHAAVDAAFARSAVALAAGLTAANEVLATCVRGRRNGQPFLPSTPFDVEAIAEEFTAALVLRLDAERTLRLEDPLELHVDRVPECWRRLSVRQLLQRRSGLPLGLELDERAAGNRDAFLSHLLRHTPRTQLGTAPAAGCRADWLVLAALAEAVTVQPFAELLGRRVFAVAGMRDAECAPTDWSERGAAGVRCSLQDMVAWLRATGSGPLFTAAAEALFFAEDDAGAAPAGRLVRDQDGRARAFQRVGRNVALVRDRVDGIGLVVYAEGDVDMPAAVTQRGRAATNETRRRPLGGSAAQS